MIETLGIKKAHLIIAASVTSLVLIVTTTLLLTKGNSNPEPSVTQIEKKLIDEQTLKPEEPNKPEKKLNEEKPTPEKVVLPEVSGTPKKETPAIGRPGALSVQPIKQPRPRMATPQKQPGTPPPPLERENSLVPPPPPLESKDSSIPPPPPEDSSQSGMLSQEQQVDQNSQSGLQVPLAPPLPEKYSSQSKSSTSVQEQQNSNSDNNPSTLTRNKTKVLSPENTQSKGQSGQYGITRQRSSSLPSLKTNLSMRTILNSAFKGFRLQVADSDSESDNSSDTGWDSDSDSVNNSKSNTGFSRFNLSKPQEEVQFQSRVQEESNQNISSTNERQDQVLSPKQNQLSDASLPLFPRLRRASCSDLSEPQKEQPQLQKSKNNKNTSSSKQDQKEQSQSQSQSQPSKVRKLKALFEEKSNSQK